MFSKGKLLSRRKVTDFGFRDISSFTWAVLNELKLTTPKVRKDFYEITSDKELEDLKKCLLKELQEEELQEEKKDD